MTHRLIALVAALLLFGGCSSPSSEPATENAESALEEGALTFTGIDVDNALLSDALDSYLVIADRLAGDSMDGLPEEAANLAEHLHAMAGDHDELHALAHHADNLATAGDIGDARYHFGRLSPPFADLVAYQNAADDDVYRMACGMAEAPGGGVWLQRGREVRNPYFGADMLRCAQDVDPLTAA